MDNIVVDSSVLLAFIFQENGHELAEFYLNHAYLSTVNLAEVIPVLSLKGMTDEEIFLILANIPFQTIDFNREQAELTARLRSHTSPIGLSFGDRACLSLGILKKAKIITADKIWASLVLDQEIIVIR